LRHSPEAFTQYLHGQCVEWNDVLHYGVQESYYLPNMITLIPSGVDEGICIQWNVGSGGNDKVCDPKRHFPSKYSTNFPSCKKTNATSICNCYGCYDDALYVHELYKKVAEELCIDSDRIFAYGLSNGGMFSYRVAAEFAKKGTPLRGFVPWYGGILQHEDYEFDSLVDTSLLAIHGTTDVEIPLQGGESQDGYLYRPLQDIMKTLRHDNKCGPMEKVDVPFTDRSFVACYVAPKCAHSSRDVAMQRVACLFVQGHGFWLECANDMMQWFFNRTETQTLLV